jgi:hypothetical protein
VRTPSPLRSSPARLATSPLLPLLASAALAFVGVLAPQRVAAQTMNVTLARLRIESSDTLDPGVATLPCARTLEVRGLPSTRSYCADNLAWGGIAEQLGISMAPPVLTPGRTLGPASFYVGAEGFISNISGGHDFWHRGTEGDEFSAAEGENRAPANALYWQRLQIRKAFPLGFELGTSMAHLFGTSYWSLGFDVKWSILEGFRTGGEGFIPDLAVRGAVQTLLGETEFNLTIPSIEVIVSKTIVLASAGTITPYLAGQYVMILGDSELVDLTPQQDAASATNPDGTPNLDDYNNNDVFAQIRDTRLRGVIGLQGRYGVLTLTGAITFDLNQVTQTSGIDPDWDPTPGVADPVLPRQWTADFGVGFSF